MRSVGWGSVLFVAVAALLSAGHAAAQGIDKADWNSPQPLGVAEQATSYGPVMLPVSSMEAEQSFRGAEFEPISVAPVVQKTATGGTMPIPSRTAPAAHSPSANSEIRPTPTFATGEPQPINRFGLH